MTVVMWSVLGVCWVVAMIAWLGGGFGSSALYDEFMKQYGPKTGRKLFFGLVVLTIIAIAGLYFL